MEWVPCLCMGGDEPSNTAQKAPAVADRHLTTPEIQAARRCLPALPSCLMFKLNILPHPSITSSLDSVSLPGVFLLYARSVSLKSH